MIVVQISGGIGNQLFQYCYAVCLQRSNPNQKVYIENSFYKFQPEPLDKRKYELDQFKNLKLELNENRFINYLHSIDSFFYKRIWYLFRIIFKPSKSFFIVKSNSGIIIRLVSKLYRNIYLIGDWQNRSFLLEDYLHTISKLELKNEIQKKLVNQKWVNKIKNKNSIAVCVRRSDYVRIGVNADRQYFNESLNYFKRKFPQAQFYFFSDDIDWCKDKFSHLSNVFFISSNFNIPFEDIILISQCNHAIISKSTFAWWGSMLIKNKNKIIIINGSWKLDKFSGIYKLIELKK